MKIEIVRKDFIDSEYDYYGELRDYVTESGSYCYIDGKECLLLADIVQPEEDVASAIAEAIVFLAEHPAMLEATRDFIGKKPIYLPEKEEEYQGRYIRLLEREPLASEGGSYSELVKVESEISLRDLVKALVHRRSRRR